DRPSVSSARLRRAVSISVLSVSLWPRSLILCGLVVRLCDLWGTARRLRSLVVQRLHRVQLRGAHGGIDAEGEAHRDGDEEGDQDRADRDDGGPTCKKGNQPRQADAHEQADQAA